MALFYPNFAITRVDEVAYYDGPAMVDYALNVTGKKHLSFIGHSMGNGIALGMLTTRPEYNHKINVWFVLAAAADVQDTRSTPLRLLAPFYRQVEVGISFMNLQEREITISMYIIIHCICFSGFSHISITEKSSQPQLYGL